MLRAATTRESNGDKGAPAPWHHSGITEGIKRQRESMLRPAPCMCIETLRNHIHRCTRRKQHLRPARARANNASHHEKHGGMWTGDGRAGIGERDSKSLQSYIPSISGNVYGKVVAGHEPPQLCIGWINPSKRSAQPSSVSTQLCSIGCPNLERAVEPGSAQGCGGRQSQP